MIIRDIPQAALDALKNDVTRVLVFFEVDWPGTPVRAHSGIGERTFMGEVYQGVGEFGGIGDIIEGSGTSPAQLPFTLTVLDSAVVALSMNDAPEGREIAMHLAVLDENRVITHEIPYLVDGYASFLTVKRGDIAKQIPYVITLTCTDWLDRWNQPPENARTTDEAQQHLHPGDRIFSLTELIAGSPSHSLPINTQSGTGGTRGNGSRYEP